MPDLSGIFSSTGAALEQQGFKQFGAYASDAATGNLNALFNNQPAVAGGALNPSDPTGPVAAAAAVSQGQSHSADWNPTPFAAALSSGIGQFDPKSPFLFKVRFAFNGLVAIEAANLGFDMDPLTRDLSYTLKQIDLPKYDFDYKEVNMYNFRTKVLTSIKHSPLGFAMYDDVGNRSLNFVNMYLQLLNPSTRREWGTDVNLEDYGFSFAQVVKAGINSSFRAAVGANGLENNQAGPGNSINILDSMTIEQYYVERKKDTGGTVRSMVKANTFVFTHPRLINFVIDEHNHEKSDAKMISAQFDFDTLYIKTGVPGQTLQSSTGDYVGYVQHNDLLSGQVPDALLGTGPNGQAGKSGNPFVDIIANQGKRLVQSSLGGYLQQAFPANSVAGRALGTVNSNISGLIGSQAATTIQGIGNGLPSISLPPVPVLASNSPVTPTGQTPGGANNPEAAT